MSYRLTRKSFSDDQELLKYLGGLPFPAGEQIGIIAGHFMLMYDDHANCLVPMVYQDATNSKVEKSSFEMAGEFPLGSFRLGLRLVQSLQENEALPKLVLIVNDHIFQTPSWSLQGLSDKNQARNLRYKFYRQKYPLPKSYFRELKAVGLTTESILDNNNSGRISDILPKQTRLFSEQALRNYFDQYRRLKLRELPLFREVTQAGTKRKLLFEEKVGGLSVCLTEEGECGCSGELIEFFIRLSRKQLTKIIFFIPDECNMAANAGVKAFLNTPKEYRKNIDLIYVISGLGGMGRCFNKDKSQPIVVNIHALE